MFFKFNQRLLAPNFNDSSNQHLIKDLFGVRYFSTYEDKVNPEINFDPMIINWTEYDMVVNMNFEQPKDASQDWLQDKLFIKFINPWIFVSKSSCLTLENTMDWKNFRHLEEINERYYLSNFEIDIPR